MNRVLRVMLYLVVTIAIVSFVAMGYIQVKTSKKLAEANAKNVAYRGTITALSEQSMDQHNEIIRLERKVIEVDPTVHKAAPKPRKKEMGAKSVPSPDSVGEPEQSLTRAEAEKAYGQANACLVGNIVAVRNGSGHFENYPDMRVVEAYQLFSQIREAGFYDLSSPLARLYNDYIVLTNDSGVPLIDEVVPNKIEEFDSSF